MPSDNSIEFPDNTGSNSLTRSRPAGVLLGLVGSFHFFLKREPVSGYRDRFGREAVPFRARTRRNGVCRFVRFATFSYDAIVLVFVSETNSQHSYGTSLICNTSLAPKG